MDSIPSQEGSYDRQALARALKHSIDRRWFCPSFVATIAGYCLFITSFIAFCDVPYSHDVERSLKDSFAAPIAAWKEPTLTSPADVYGWLSETLVPVVATRTLLTNESAAEFQREGSFFTVGSIRLSQNRFHTADCPSAKLFSGLPQPIASTQCAIRTVASLSPYGSPKPAVAAAFERHPLTHNTATLEPYEFVLATEQVTSASTIDDLAEAGWIDVGTNAVGISAAFFFPERVRWGYIFFGATRTPGGTLEKSVLVNSIPLDWSSLEWYTVLDALRTFLVLYAVWLVCLVGWELIFVLRLAWQRQLPAMWQKLQNGQLFLDTAFTALLIAMLSLWTDISSGLTSMQLLAGSNWSANPETPTLMLHSAFIGTSEERANFRRIGVAAVFVATGRVFMGLQMQPRMAALGTALWQGLGDVVHILVGFSVVLVAYGVWGHVYFGRQVKDYSTVGLSAEAVMRLIMYDYDLLAMNEVDSAAASSYFGSFMFLVTNMIFWMFLAIVIDAYGLTRAEARLNKDAWSDSISSLAGLPAACAEEVAATQRALRRTFRVKDAELLPSNKTASNTPHLPDLLRALPACGQGEEVTAAQLAAAIGASTASVAKLAQASLEADTASENDATRITLHVLRGAWRSAVGRVRSPTGQAPPLPPLTPNPLPLSTDAASAPSPPTGDSR